MLKDGRCCQVIDIVDKLHEDTDVFVYIQHSSLFWLKCLVKDYYMIFDNFYNHIEEEYKNYKKLIIAVDFDYTIYDFHKKGRDYNCVINLLRRWKDHAEIIIFTASGEKRFDSIRRYMYESGIPFNSINKDSEVPVRGRKLYANVYIDDRAGINEPYYALDLQMNK